MTQAPARWRGRPRHPGPARRVVTEPFSTTVPYRVRFDEADPAGRLRTSGLLRYAQDCAWIHSERLGFDRAWYAARGLWWLVRCAELEVTGEIRMGETVEVTTTVVGYRKVWARRRTDVARESGERVAGVITDWVITDSRGLPTRVPDEFVALFGSAVPSFTPGPRCAAADARRGGHRSRSRSGRRTWIRWATSTMPPTSTTSRRA